MYYDELSSNQEIKNVVIFSGHGSTSYYNITYQYRYKNIEKILKKNKKLENIFILGRIQEIPEQKILESLIFNQGIEKEKIRLIYKDYSNTAKNINKINFMLKKENINSIVFVTSPYHSKRAKLLWSKYDLDVKFWKGYEWPNKNNFFE